MRKHMPTSNKQINMPRGNSSVFSMPGNLFFNALQWKSSCNDHRSFYLNLKLKKTRSTSSKSLRQHDHPYLTPLHGTSVPCSLTESPIQWNSSITAPNHRNNQSTQVPEHLLRALIRGSHTCGITTGRSNNHRAVVPKGERSPGKFTRSVK